MQTRKKTEEQQRYEISRLVAFSDGVFGFAITLLIVNVISAFPPLPSSASDERLVGALLGLGSTFFSYALSFYVGGAYWVAHHRMFSYLILYIRGRGWITLALFVLSIGLAFLSPLLARISWFAIFLIRPLLLRLLLKEEETVSHFLHGLAPAHVDAEKKPPTEHQP